MWLNPKLKYLHTVRPSSRGAKRLSATAGLMNGSAYFALSLSSRVSLFLIAKLRHSSHNFMLLRPFPLTVWAAYVYGILPFVITARMHRG